MSRQSRIAYAFVVGAIAASMIASFPAGAATPAAPASPAAQAAPALSGDPHVAKPALTPEQEKLRADRRAKRAERARMVKEKFDALPEAERQKIKALGDQIKALDPDHRRMLMHYVHGGRKGKASSGWRDHNKGGALASPAMGSPAAASVVPASPAVPVVPAH